MSKDAPGFLVWPREPAPERSASQRLGDFREFVSPMPDTQLTRQAERCMDCGIPFCHQGCPLGNLVPDFNDAVRRNQHRVAWEILSSTNNFPEFTGRICPAPCESACVLALDGAPVTIEQIEKAIIERAFEAGWVQPRVVTERSAFRVAVVGSGPAGLAAADQLNQAGHRVEVFEKADRVGGLLRYGIPDFKLDKWVIDRRVRLLAAEGIEFKTGVHVGQSPTWTGLRADFDAVVICVGAELPRSLHLPGADLPGVHAAMDYLIAQNQAVTAGGPSTMSAAGQHVIVLGGGDTGSDCLGTALRQGAASITQIELMPAPPTQRELANPWPRWPVVFRTSSSQAEGGERAFAWMTEKLTGTDRLEALHARPVEQRDGQLVPTGEARTWPVDLLLLAMGFTGAKVDGLAEAFDLDLAPRAALKTDTQRRLLGRAGPLNDVFVAGDAARGASLVVYAISEGREVARAVDAHLKGVASLPTRGANLPFDGR
ncbi:MAG: glutamate synthase (NADPH/NADH) small chain [Bradymonadia bacterium]|jgi:glutamate synthase (NADPH/NADH) small chain